MIIDFRYDHEKTIIIAEIGVNHNGKQNWQRNLLRYCSEYGLC